MVSRAGAEKQVIAVSRDDVSMRQMAFKFGRCCTGSEIFMHLRDLNVRSIKQGVCAKTAKIESVGTVLECR
jgi:hypothetical protein